MLSMMVYGNGISNELPEIRSSEGKLLNQVSSLELVRLSFQQISFWSSKKTYSQGIDYYVLV